MEVTTVAPHNIRTVIKPTTRMSQSQASLAQSTSSGPLSTPGFRAGEAFVRPSATYTAGNLLKSGFNLRNCTFTLSLTTRKAAPEDAPTEIFLPDFHFPASQTVVSVSSGRWAIQSDEERSSTVQRLRWWHGGGVQEIKIQGVKRKANEVLSGSTIASGMEESYLEQCQKGSCTVT
jgi:Glycoside hydrolase family 5 C-terminal domain